MLLKVGELARHTGLTVRTLHHYDSLGLLKPSARSEAGYRLYDRADVARLHGIQALRRMGLALADIGGLLQSDGSTLPALIARQLKALEQDIAQANALHQRLSLMQAVLAAGGQPDMEDWLASLNLMGSYADHFSVDELARIFRNWKTTEADWQPLVRAVRQAMQDGVPAQSLQLQPLARQWMDLSVRWMDGDMDLLTRWRHVLREHPHAFARGGVDAAMLDYIGTAIQLRLDTMARYLSADELQRLDKTLGFEWRALSERANALVQQAQPHDGPDAQALAHDWATLMSRAARGDDTLVHKMAQAHANDPVLRAGSSMSPAARELLHRALNAMPSATARARRAGERADRRTAQRADA